ncbi:MAG: LysR family transcriptional regulator [Haliangiales bacterium]
MDLDNLKALIAVADRGSVAAAARALTTSVGTLRRRLAELEAEVGEPVLARRGRRHALTAAGRVLAGDGRALLADAQALIEQVKSDGRAPTGEYRIAVPLGMPPQLAAMVIVGHFTRFPGVRLRPLPVAAPATLLPDEADIAVTFEPCPADGPWLTAVIRRSRELVLASRRYLDRHGAPETPEALHQHPLLSWIPPGEEPGAWPLRGGGQLAVQPILTSPDIQLVRQCMLAGLGIARVPDGDVPDLGYAPGAAVPVLPEQLGRELVLRVIMPDSAKMRAPFRRFVGSIRDEVQAV